MSLITIEKNKCTKCEMCVKSCPVNIIKMGPEGFPVDHFPKACIACGHCVAVCPNDAIDNEKTPKSQLELISTEKITEKQAEEFLRSRRSIRNFKNEKVSREDLTKLVDIARQAPTGSNAQQVSFLIIDNKEILKQAVEDTISFLEKSPIAGYVAISKTMRENWENGIDRILRNAPALVVTLSNEGFQRGRENSIFCLTYLELFAPSINLGSCWAGFLEFYAMSQDSTIPKLFNIPDGKVVTGAVMVGKPKFNYKRLTNKNPLDVSFL